MDLRRLLYIRLWFVCLAGCCQHEKHGQQRSFNAGNANAALTITDGLLVLTYAGGERCNHVAVNRSSIITFVCAAGNDTESTTSLGRPHFVNEDDCTYKFTWHTALACLPMVCLSRLLYLFRSFPRFYNRL